MHIPSLPPTLLLLVFAVFFTKAQSAPEVTIKNGTLRGVHSNEWNQDFFLGIPYAQPPIGDLRFRWPQPINESWEGVRDASRYGYSCYQYGSGFELSEDCLTVNVIRPAGHDYEVEKLPVLVWIYGGGLYAGSSADPQYNLSALVHTSTLTPHPFIAVSLNYRLGIWGFLQTPSLLSEGSSNAGLLDQRLALHWVQENIASFGGDPARVTLWGESAGAQSIAWQTFAFAGEDEGLFSAVILESGGAEGAPLNTLPFYQSAVMNVSMTVGCPTDWRRASQLACLRGLSSAQLFATTYSVTWNPIVDGVFLSDYPSVLRSEGRFVKTPVLVGANTDEGVSFSVTTPKVETEEDLYRTLFYWRNYALGPRSIRRLLELYPDDLGNSPPYADRSNQTYESRGYGRQWRRSAAIGGDLVMIAQRRATAKQYAAAGQDVWSYRFDTPLWNASIPGSVKHFDNVMFSFQNTSGAMGPLPEYQKYRVLSEGIGRVYANFVGTHDPNGKSGSGGKGTGHETIPFAYWPKWTESEPKNIVLNASGSFVENDTFRTEGIDFINSIWRELLA